MTRQIKYWHLFHNIQFILSSCENSHVLVRAWDTWICSIVVSQHQYVCAMKLWLSQV